MGLILLFIAMNEKPNKLATLVKTLSLEIEFNCQSVCKSGTVGNALTMKFNFRNQIELTCVERCGS